MYFWRRFKVKNVLAEYENTKISACGGQIVKIFQNVSKKGSQNVSKTIQNPAK